MGQLIQRFFLKIPGASETIEQQLDPVGHWDLIPYVNFRTQSEQEKLKEEVFG
jgi:hypothetical protein